MSQTIYQVRLDYMGDDYGETYGVVYDELFSSLDDAERVRVEQMAKIAPLNLWDDFTVTLPDSPYLNLTYEAALIYRQLY